MTWLVPLHLLLLVGNVRVQPQLTVYDGQSWLDWFCWLIFDGWLLKVWHSMSYGWWKSVLGFSISKWSRSNSLRGRSESFSTRWSPLDLIRRVTHLLMALTTRFGSFLMVHILNTPHQIQNGPAHLVERSICIIFNSMISLIWLTVKLITPSEPHCLSLDLIRSETHHTRWTSLSVVGCHLSDDSLRHPSCFKTV